MQMKKLTGIRSTEVEKFLLKKKVEKFVKNEMKSFQQHPISVKNIKINLMTIKYREKKIVPANLNETLKLQKDRWR